MGQRGLIGRLVDEVTYRSPAQNPTLARHGLLGEPAEGDRRPRHFAGWSTAAEFGPPPAVHFAHELAGRSDGELLDGPQRRSPGHAAARRPVGARR